MSVPSAARARSSAGSPPGPDPARTPSGIVQAVPHAPDGLDPVALRPELRPEVVDVGIDRVGCHRDAERPGLVEELIAAEGLAGVAQERLQQRELARAQVD